jgi:hypothetical protein
MRRHDFDALSFLFGLAFAGFGLVLLGGEAIHDGLALAWVGPVVAIAGAVLIVLAARPRPERVAAAAWEVEPAPDDAGA